MKEIEYIIHTWDDVVFAETGEKVLAEHRGIVLAFNGEEITLDLTKESIKAIREKLTTLFAIGVPVKRKPAIHIEPYQGMHPRARTEKAAMRAFAAEHGIEVPKNKGGYVYSRELRDAWANHVAEARGYDSAGNG